MVSSALSCWQVISPSSCRPLCLAVQARTLLPERYVIPSSSRLWSASLDTARTQVGIRERTGRNDGPLIFRYQRAVGIPPGSSYCMGGQFWTFLVAARDLKESIPILRSGLASAVYHDAARRGRKTAFVPHVGDLIFWRKGATIYGHVERIVALHAGGWVTTVGFNTSCDDAGSMRDGGGVCYKRRHIMNPVGALFILGLVGRSDDLVLNGRDHRSGKLTF